MTACIFCAIVAGQAPASVVYEDDLTLAFLDLRQELPGHVLIVPKQHIVTLDQLPAKLAGPLLATVVQMTALVQRVLQPDGVNIWQSNGVAAGQEVFHVHFHVFPRKLHDGQIRIYPSRPGQPPRSELDALAARLRAGLPNPDA